PPTTAHGALIRHLTEADPDHFQPMNVNFGLFAPLGRRLPKRQRGAAYAERAIRDWAAFLARS
ncbi:methylenetetrahydrofolate--tRNA-(uracil(54)-C(5))-methyltransferase (FADH(2)-oxidizing) TrmFO, partial [Dissulfurirhabdus thermomarina]|nr:methylenetetrahydrofolate--tRNA-(uracil(54)-C(5))-methyltransferase (FADH(2)-oxidizing) TrmFO [Dissulfurirhabdus thermomarina]